MPLPPPGSRWPSAFQHSSARCGIIGASMTTKASAPSRSAQPRSAAAGFVSRRDQHVAQLVELRDRAVEAQAFDVLCHTRRSCGARDGGGRAPLRRTWPGAGAPVPAAQRPGAISSRQTRCTKRCAPSTPASVQITSRSGGEFGQHEPARGVGAVVREDVGWVDGVLLRLRHLLDRADLDRLAGAAQEGAALVAFALDLDARRLDPLAGGVAIGLVHDHALREHAGEGLVWPAMPRLLHRAGEEARIEEVQDRVLDAADILVDGQPAIDDRRHRRRPRMRRGEAREIPGRVRRTCPSCRSRAAPGRHTAGSARFARSDAGRADCPAGRTRRRREASPAARRAAPAPRRRSGSGSSGSGSPSSAGAKCPSRAGGSSPAARRRDGCRASRCSSRRATSSFASSTVMPSRKRGIDQPPVADIGGVGDDEGLRILPRRGRRPA